MKRWTVFMLFIIVSLCIPLSGEAAEKPHVKWGKVQFEERHVGKVSVKQKVNAYKMSKGSLVKQKTVFGANREFAVLKTIRQKNVTYYQISPSLYIQNSKKISFSKPTKTVINQLKKEKVDYAGTQYISYLDRVKGRDFLDNINTYMMMDLNFDGYPELFMGMEAMTSPELYTALTIENHQVKKIVFTGDTGGSNYCYGVNQYLLTCKTNTLHLGVPGLLNLERRVDSKTKKGHWIANDGTQLNYNNYQGSYLELKLNGTKLYAKERFYYQYDNEYSLKESYRVGKKKVSRSVFEKSLAQYKQYNKPQSYKKYHSSYADFDDAPWSDYDYHIEQGMKKLKQ